MTVKEIQGTSATGKMAFAVLCAENYALAVFPERDWSPLFRYLWTITSCEYWDEWAYAFVEMQPDCIMEFGSYQESDFEKLDEDTYRKLRELYQGMPEAWTALLDNLRCAAEDYGYNCKDPEGLGAEAMEEIVSILNEAHVQIPNNDFAAISPASENNGYGNRFKGDKLSRIL